MSPGAKVLSLGAALALLPGCGERERLVVQPPSVYERPARPAVLVAPGDFGVEEVRATVARFTGHRLEVEEHRDGVVNLSAAGPGAYQALGSFNLYVARDRRTRDALVRRWGRLFGPPYRDEGVRFLRRAELEIDGRRFTRAAGELRAYDEVEDIPSRLEPGEEGEALFVFDVPRSPAARAERDGTMVVTGRAERPFEDAPDSPRTSPTVARVRLRPR